jgi:hypothetical protein
VPTPPRARFVVIAAALASVLAVAACGDVGALLSPGRPMRDAPARLSVALQLPATALAATGGALALDVLTAYDRTDGQVALLDSTRVALTETATQRIALTLDLAPCLTDPRHRRDPSGAPACSLRLVVALMRGDVVLDAAEVGPYWIAVGSRTVLPDVVPLFEVASVFLSLAVDSVPLPAVVGLGVGEQLPLRANAVDVEGVPVTGRTVGWTSSNPDVADVTAQGVVTARTPGQARVTGIVGGRAASITLLVLPGS